MQVESISQELRLFPNNAIQQSSQQNFGDALKEAIMDVNSFQVQASKAVEQMVTGEAASIHDVMIAVEKARTSFDLLLEVRNKALDMYREIMRVQI
ncbi:MAG: flagellar hook-basal body complex protein FliE [Ignavibacteriales bacterium]|nr:flagellar hook-basal body complex protein FliE [Ignavibacteriales bacterium]